MYVSQTVSIERVNTTKWDVKGLPYPKGLVQLFITWFYYLFYSTQYVYGREKIRKKPQTFTKGLSIDTPPAPMVCWPGWP